MHSLSGWHDGLKVESRLFCQNRENIDSSGMPFLPKKKLNGVQGTAYEDHGQDSPRGGRTGLDGMPIFRAPGLSVHMPLTLKMPLLLVPLTRPIYSCMKWGIRWWLKRLGLILPK